MKRIAIALLFVLIAVGAQAATIFDLQNEMYAVGDIVDVTGVTVVAVRYNGVYVSEAPHAAYNGIWVYGPVDFVEGDIIDIIGGEFTEYYDLSEIIATDAVVTLTGTGPVPAPTMIDAATLFADAEPYESCMVTVTDGMIVTELGSYGQWVAQTLDGLFVDFDDYFYDVSTVLVGDCYNSVTAICDYSFSAYKLQPLVEGIELTDCTVATDELSFEAVKALYR
jgi:hypothetical protein